jgi:hypothetical protein
MRSAKRRASALSAARRSIAACAFAASAARSMPSARNEHRPHTGAIPFVLPRSRAYAPLSKAPSGGIVVGQGPVRGTRNRRPHTITITLGAGINLNGTPLEAINLQPGVMLYIDGANPNGGS